MPEILAAVGWEGSAGLVELATSSTLRLPLQVPEGEIGAGAYALLASDTWEEGLTWDVPRWPLPIALAPVAAVPGVALEGLAEHLRDLATETALVAVMDVPTAVRLAPILESSDEVVLAWDVGLPPDAAIDELIAVAAGGAWQARLCPYRQPHPLGEAAVAAWREGWGDRWPGLPPEVVVGSR